LLTAKPRIRFLLVLLMTQGLFPLPLQLTRYQSILGLYGALLPRRARRAVVRPL